MAKEDKPLTLRGVVEQHLGASFEDEQQDALIAALERRILEERRAARREMKTAFLALLKERSAYVEHEERADEIFRMRLRVESLSDREPQT